jgi:hypothetical protein
MSLLLNGSTGYLEFPGRIINNLPGTIVVFTSANITGASQMWAVQQQSNADRYIAAWLDANGTTKYGAHRIPGGGDSATRAAAPNPVAGSLQIAAAVFASTTSRTMYYGSNAGSSSSVSVVDDIVNHDRVTVGAWRYNGGAAGLFTNGEVAEAHFYNVALTATDVENIRTGAVLPEALAGWVDGWTLQNFNAGGTYTSIGGSRTLTAVGGVSAGIRAHPITRSAPGAFAGAITLDGVTLAGSFQGVAAGAFSGAVALDGVTLSGSFGTNPGTLVSEPLRTNNGTLLASTAMAHVSVYNDTTGALVVRRTDLSTNASGVFTITDPAIGSGTTYRIDWETSGGHRRMPRKLAA